MAEDDGTVKGRRSYGQQAAQTDSVYISVAIWNISIRDIDQPFISELNCTDIHSPQQPDRDKRPEKMKTTACAQCIHQTIRKQLMCRQAGHVFNGEGKNARGHDTCG